MDFVTDPWADHWALAGGLLALLVAVLAWWGDRRRMRRRDPDRVGWVPWTGLSFWSLFVAALLLVAAVQQWLRPGG